MKYGEFLSGFEVFIDQDNLVDKIMDYAALKMGQELPADARTVIEKWTGASYKLGLGQDWSDAKWKVTDRNALAFFRRHDQYFFGNQFQHYSDDLRTVVENELKGVRAYNKEVVDRLREKMGEAFEHPYVKDYYDLVVRNAVNKSRNFGRVFNYERLGIAEVEIVAIRDQKTSRICREMDGRRVEVKFLADHVREVLSTPMNELTEKFAWPTDADAKSYEGLSTADILGHIKTPLPPFHGRCRTTTVIGKRITVRKSTGGSFSGELAYDDKNEAARTRAGMLGTLRNDELLSKMDGLAKTGYWDNKPHEWPDGTERMSREFHEEKHGHEFKEGYDTALKNLLKSYSNVYTYLQGEAPVWIVREAATKKYLLLNDAGKILTFHRQDRVRRRILETAVEIL
ncbi:MAG: hypothetical protein EPN93_17420 [Spirochaetes bacterium]|nr:MAG: hypothetical protein EPN93_17420 [Spirochaetota bacterium]